MFEYMNRKYAHISVDDVTFVFQRLSSCSYESIYDDKFFRWIHLLHRFVGLKITLYVYFRYADFSLSDIPDLYTNDFKRASNWLKLGFHAVSEKQNENGILSSFSQAYEKAQLNILRFAGEKSIAKVLRLHYWFYPKEYIDVLKRHGVSVILKNEGQLINSSSIKSWETQICLENHTLFEILRKAKNNKGTQPLVIFTHEWALNQRIQFKMLLVVLMVKLRGYKFVC